MPQYNIPSKADLLDTLTMLVGDDAQVKPGDTTALENFSHLAQFVDDDDVLVGACLADLPLCAAMGASLSMIGPAAVEDMVAEKALTDTVVSNLYEVMNIMSSLLMSDRSPHLRLTTVAACDDVLSELAFDGFERVDFSVEAGKYGTGEMSFLVN